MARNFTTGQKLRTAAALVMVFLVVLATNLIDKHHFSIVQSSLTSVYEDRLMAKNYIYRISRQMQLKQDALVSGNPEKVRAINKVANDSISLLLSKYADTKLTNTESRYFQSVSKKIAELIRSEKNLGEGEIINAEIPSSGNMSGHYTRIFEDLDVLSEIQVTEGKREIFLSNETINKSNWISKIEIGVLIVIALMLQILIFVKPLK